MEEFTGKVIAIIRRLNDVEDKWGVSQENKLYSNRIIRPATKYVGNIKEYKDMDER